jgi:hypothetical protein
MPDSYTVPIRKQVPVVRMDEGGWCCILHPDGSYCEIKPSMHPTILCERLRDWLAAWLEIEGRK